MGGASLGLARIGGLLGPAIGRDWAPAPFGTERENAGEPGPLVPRGRMFGTNVVYGCAPSCPTCAGGCCGCWLEDGCWWGRLDGRIEGEEVSKDGWEAERLPWNSLATLKLFAVVVEGIQVDGMADEDILEEVANVDEVVGGVAYVEARLGEADDADITVDIGREECLDGTADEPDFPFIRLDVGAVAGRDPNDLTLSFLTTGVVVGDDETGAEASSIEPKFKEDPVSSMDVWQEILVR